MGSLSGTDGSFEPNHLPRRCCRECKSPSRRPDGGPAYGTLCGSQETRPESCPAVAASRRCTPRWRMCCALSSLPACRSVLLVDGGGGGGGSLIYFIHFSLR